MCPVRQNAIQRTVGTAHLSVLTTVDNFSAHTAQNSSDNLPFYIQCCFATAGPRLWNLLPSELRQCYSLGEFKRLLTTHLFGDHGAL